MNREKQIKRLKNLKQIQKLGVPMDKIDWDKLDGSLNFKENKRIMIDYIKSIAKTMENIEAVEKEKTNENIKHEKEMDDKTKEDEVEREEKYTKEQLDKSINEIKTKSTKKLEEYFYTPKKLVETVVKSDNTNGLILKGNAGTGKSLKEGEKIIVLEGNKTKRIPIEDFKFNPEKEQKILSLNQDLKTELKEITDYNEFDHKGEIINIKTRTGREVNATPCHSFVTINKNGELKVKKGSELSKGDIIPLLNSSVPESVPELKKSTIELKKGYKQISVDYELDSDFGFICGLYLADGVTAKKDKKYYRCLFSNSDKKTRKKLKNCFEDKDIHYWENEQEVRIMSKEFVYFIEKNFGRLAGNKFINPNLFFSNEEFKKGLISGYFSGDGEIGEYIGWTSKSKRLTEDIAFILSTLNIGTTKQKKELYKGKYKGNIYHKGYVFSKKKFIEDIPIYRERDVKVPCQGYSKFEGLPIDSEFIKRFGRKNHLSSKRNINIRKRIRGIIGNSKRGSVTNYSIKNFLELCNEKNIGLKGKEYQTIEKLLNSDIIFDRIEKIDKEEYEGKVYDISVKDNENFITSEGLFVHNSYTTVQKLREMGLKKGKDFEVINSYITPLSLYRFLYRHRSKTIIIDDTMGFFSNDKIIGIILSALWGDSGKRVVQYSSSKLNDIPNKFEFEGEMIVCLNDIPNQLEHIKSRCFYYEINFSNKELMEMVTEVAKLNNIPMEIIDFIKDNLDSDVVNLDFRLLFKVYDVYKNNKDWKEIASDLINRDKRVGLMAKLLKKHDTVGEARKEWVRKTGDSRATFFRIKTKYDVE